MVGNISQITNPLYNSWFYGIQCPRDIIWKLVVDTSYFGYYIRSNGAVAKTGSLV